MGLMLPPTRGPVMKPPTWSAGPAPSSRTLTHVHQAVSLPVEQVEEPTLRDGPVVTRRPPARQLDSIPVNLRKNRISRQAEAA